MTRKHTSQEGQAGGICDGWLAREVVAPEMYRRVRASYQRALRQQDRERRWTFPWGVVRLECRETVIGNAHEALASGMERNLVLDAYGALRLENRDITVSVASKAGRGLQRVGIHVTGASIVGTRRDAPPATCPRDPWFTFNADRPLLGALLSERAAAWFELEFETGAALACPARNVGSALACIASERTQPSLLATLVAGAHHDDALSLR